MTQPTPIRKPEERPRTRAADVASAVIYVMLAATILTPFAIFGIRLAAGWL